MQQHHMAEKVRLLIDGEEVSGLVKISEMSVEKGTIEVPEFRRIRMIQNGIQKIPVLELTYEVQRDTETLAFFRNWFYKDEVKDVTKIRTDAHGVEFARTLMPDCECTKYSEPETDHSSPGYAQINLTLLPWDVIPQGPA